MKLLDRFTGAVIHEADCENVRDLIQSAVLAGKRCRYADLSGANLGGADLGGADLRSANLGGADLSGANLSSANLSSADLSGAHLRSANLSSADLGCANLGSADLGCADLSGANLRSANLSSANLRSANLGGANLRSADLSGANLRSANLSVFRDDLYAVLSFQPSEVAGLRAAIANGEIDGSTYSTASCSCLSGTLEKCAIASNHKFDASPRNVSRPIERFFAAIKPGDTPANSQFSKLALKWVDAWLEKMHAAFDK